MFAAFTKAGLIQPCTRTRGTPFLWTPWQESCALSCISAAEAVPLHLAKLPFRVTLFVLFSVRIAFGNS